MQRQWNNKPLELLAPAGTFDTFKAIIDSSCDAVYCGGRILNMRMIRKGYNLSHEELKEATALAREKGKKIYITVNSLLDQSELNQAAEFLEFLEEICPHGLIVQDPAVLKIARDRKLSLPLHASVMMNVHNLDMIRRLERWGISRVVLSREMSLKQAGELSCQTDMELEYFTHGDMCSVHGSQCLFSSYLFGMSSNRGRCLKPCRWPMEGAEKPFPLAVKDISLYCHLPDMIRAGICSFKIEGRMRPKEFIVPLVNRYGEALDRFLEHPEADRRPDMEDMEPFKKRDFSTAYAFGKPGLANINTLGEGTGKFYSTGKMFSTPVKEPLITAAADDGAAAGSPAAGSPAAANIRRLSVKVGGIDQARQVLEYGPGRIYLSAEPFAPLELPSPESIRSLSGMCREQGCELFLALPRMTDGNQRLFFEGLLSEQAGLKECLDGLLIGHSGMLEWDAAKGMKLHCDSSLNLYNAGAAAFLAEEGAAGWTPSLELPFDSLLSLPGALKRLGFGEMDTELILHGVPTVMYMDLDVSDRKEHETVLDTGKSLLRIRRDIWNRYHLLPESELSLIPRLEGLLEAGYESFRLEIQDYGKDETTALMKTARLLTDTPGRSGELFAAMTSGRGGYSYGAQGF